jgi:hypothetical protein
MLRTVPHRDALSQRPSPPPSNAELLRTLICGPHITSSGISDRTSQMPSGTIIKSSTYPNTGTKSGMTSIGEKRISSNGKRKDLGTPGYTRMVSGEIDGVNVSLPRTRPHFQVVQHSANGDGHPHFSLHRVSGRSSPRVSSADT